MVFASQCCFCTHVSPIDTEMRVTCAAFPDGIPDEILMWSEHDHTLPYPGDHGIRFTPKDANCAEYQKDMFRLPIVVGTLRPLFHLYGTGKIGKIVKKPDGKTYDIEVVNDPDDYLTGLSSLPGSTSSGDTL